MNLSMKQTHKHEEQICGCQEEGGEGVIKRGLRKAGAKLLYLG